MPISINPVNTPGRNNPSTMEKIAMGVDMASKILGTGINAYKIFGIDKPAQEAQTNYYNAESTQLPTRYGFEMANTGEKGAHQLAGQGDQLFVNKNEPQIENQGLRLTTMGDDKEEHDATNLQKALDVSVASSRSPLGKAANNFYASQRVRQLIDQNPNPTPQQMYEIARSTDTILSQTQSTLSGTEHLIPRSAMGDSASFINYFTNQPGGAGMQSWVKNLSDTVDREGELARNQVNAKLDAVAKASAGGRLARTNPERYKNIIESYRGSLLNLQQAIPDTSGLNPSNVNNPNAPIQGSSGPHGPSVIQNGHTYNWNPQTKQYE